MRNTPAVRAIVVYSSVTWVAGAHHGTLQHFPTRAVWHWADLLAASAPRFDESGGVIVVRASADDKTRRELTKGFLDALRERGWRASDEGARTGWFQVIKQGAPSISFGVLDWMDDSRIESLFLRTEAAPVIALRLATYHNVTGGRWCGTGGLSGCAQIRALPRRESPLWHWKDAAKYEAPGCAIEARSRLPLPDEAVKRGWCVHHFDIRSQYLAAAMNAELGWGAPEQRGPQAFDPARPGYWRVRVDQLPADPWGGVLYKPADSQGLTWVTTPRLRYLLEREDPTTSGMVEVVDSVTAHRQSRVLKAWAERLREARVSPLAEEILPAIKDTYARTVGMFRRPGGRIHRHDWRDTVVDTGAANLLRKVDALGVLPEHVIRWRTDSVWIVDPQPYPDELLARLGPDTGQVGKLRYEGTLTIDEYRERFPDVPRERTP